MSRSMGNLQDQTMISKRPIEVLQWAGQFVKLAQLRGGFPHSEHQPLVTNLNFRSIQRFVGNRLARNFVMLSSPIQGECSCNNSSTSTDKCETCKQKRLDTLQRQLITPHGQGGGFLGLLDRDRRVNCTPNPYGNHLPPVGTDHTPPSLMLPCKLTEGQVLISNKWCLDSQQRHQGERCYREIPKSYCAPANQYCYTRQGCCHNSRDYVSIVEPSSPGAGESCDNAYRCFPGHIRHDVLPEMLSNLKKKISR